MNTLFAVSAILAGVMLVITLLIMIGASKRSVNPYAPVSKRMIGVVLLSAATISLMGVQRAVGGPRWIWILCGLVGIILFIVLQLAGKGKKVGFEDTVSDSYLRRDSALARDDWKALRVPAKFDGDGRDASIVLDIKRGWWMGGLALPRVLVNGLAYPVKAGRNELWVEPGVVNIVIYCVDQIRFGDASIEIRVDRDRPRALYYAQPTTLLGANGAIGETPVRHPWLVSTTVWLLLLLISLGGAVAPIVRERMGM